MLRVVRIVRSLSLPCAVAAVLQLVQEESFEMYSSGQLRVEKSKIRACFEGSGWCCSTFDGGAVHL